MKTTLQVTLVVVTLAVATVATAGVAGLVIAGTVLPWAIGCMAGYGVANTVADLVGLTDLDA